MREVGLRLDVGEVELQHGDPSADNRDERKGVAPQAEPGYAVESLDQEVSLAGLVRTQTGVGALTSRAKLIIPNGAGGAEPKLFRGFQDHAKGRCPHWHDAIRDGSRQADEVSRFGAQGAEVGDVVQFAVLYEVQFVVPCVAPDERRRRRAG
ncbi:hypothetical protein [Streptomyces sp. NPDC096311]|uniref:hypothetical protein n=1 Tax=Streptomyces sp. NPDC096311 TaxID=3366083 RepID=UPI0038053899